MNKLTIIGNLTRDPETRTTQSGKNVCTFTVAVNKRNRDQDPDYFRVKAWDKMGENCGRYLGKGRKVAVVGPVSVSTYTANDGTTRAQLEVTANDMEFLSSQFDGQQTEALKPQTESTVPAGYEEVSDDDLTF